MLGWTCWEMDGPSGTDRVDRMGTQVCIADADADLWGWLGMRFSVWVWLLLLMDVDAGAESWLVMAMPETTAGGER